MKSALFAVAQTYTRAIDSRWRWPPDRCLGDAFVLVLVGGDRSRDADPAARAAVALRGLGANLSEDSLYFGLNESADSAGVPRRFRLRFAAGETPPVGAFWSLSAVGASDLFFVANPIGRYAIGDRTKGLTLNPDGSLDLRIQHDEPDEGAANWLPVPAGEFVLMLRAYEPKPEILLRTWSPPAVRRAERMA